MLMIQFRYKIDYMQQNRPLNNRPRPNGRTIDGFIRPAPRPMRGVAPGVPIRPIQAAPQAPATAPAQAPPVAAPTVVPPESTAPPFEPSVPQSPLKPTSTPPSDNFYLQFDETDFAPPYLNDAVEDTMSDHWAEAQDSTPDLPATEQGSAPHVSIAAQDPPPEDMFEAQDSPESKQPRKGPARLRLPIMIASFFGLIWGGAALLNAFVFQSYYVDGLSMQPTLQDDDRILVSKVEMTSAEVRDKEYTPSRGDIVVLDSATSSLTTLGNEQIIKRVIGVPGDTVAIAGGEVIVRNEQNPTGFNVDEKLGLDVAPTFNTGPSIIQVPEGHIFVLGDNRTEGGSYDSRIFGTISDEHVQGRLLVRVLPLRQVRVF